MTVHSSEPGSAQELAPRIVVVGVGGAGGNAVCNMIEGGLKGAEFVVANTDAQALELSACTHRVQLGWDVTRGLGAGSHPEVGRAATEESLSEIVSAIEGAQMVFITAGMGGGTGTGGAPVVAQAAREAGILTVGVVTKPFHFEGIRRMRVAEAGITELGRQVDTLIVIPNQNLFRVSDEKTTFADAFRIADEVLHSGVREITDLIVMPGLVNLDFADIRSVMAEMGRAIMGTGEAEGENRALEAAEAAISNPLLDEVSMRGARGVLINIVGGLDLTLFEVDQAANRIREEVDAEANIIFGSVFDQRLEGRMRVSVVATGIDTEAQGELGAERGAERPKVVPLSLIVSRSMADKPARRKASQEAPERPAQPTPAQATPAQAIPAAPDAEAETARDDGAAGKESVPEPASTAFPNPAAPAKSAGKSAAKPAAGPVGSDPGKAKLRFDPDARPSAGPLFASRATGRPEPAPLSEKATNGDARRDRRPILAAPGPLSEKATNGDARRDRRPSFAAPDPAERILPNGVDRKPPSVFRLLRH